MTGSLQERISNLVHQVLDSYAGAWLVWCDPVGDWLPLLKQAAERQPNGFVLVDLPAEATKHTAGLQARAALQARIAAGQPFVLCVPRAADRLGWLWAQALLAEWIYSRSLRDQLRDWGWRPHSLTLSDAEVAALARRYAQADPADWGGGGLQPDKALLLEVLAGGAQPELDQRLLLDMTVEQAGLPAVDEANLPRWRAQCLARLLVTEAHSIAPALVPGDHALLIAAPQRALALQVLAGWTDSVRLGQRLPDAVEAADQVANLGPLLAAAQGMEGPFLSQAGEQAVFAGTCSRLEQLAGQPLLEELAGLEPALARHGRGFWGQAYTHPKAIPWIELERLSRAARLLLEAGITRPWSGPQEAIAWYTSDGWRAERAGEEIMRDLSKPAPALLKLVGPLRAAYRARWEQAMIEWSRVWSEVGCPLPRLSTAGGWLAKELEQQRPTAILVLDALRYDLGHVLAERINHQEGMVRARVTAARAPLPSVTALGMALALPIPEDQIEADLADGVWQARQQGHDADLGAAAGRRAWWQSQAHVPVDALLDMGAVQAGHIPAPGPGRTRLVVYDSAIDKLGHDDELEAQGTGVIVDRYLLAVERLRAAGWLRILVVTDHGYIHWPSGEEKNAPRPLATPEPAYASRRAMAYPAHVSFGGPQGLAPGGRWRIAVPHGAASFRTYGGLGYFHGGASLQEWIIPCLAVEWPLEAQPVNVKVEPMPQVLGQQVRVGLRIERASLFVEEAMPRLVEIIIRDAGTHTILFRSKPVSATPDRDQLDVSVQALEGSVAARGAALRIEVLDSHTADVLDSRDSTLVIELTGW